MDPSVSVVSHVRDFLSRPKSYAMRFRGDCSGRDTGLPSAETDLSVKVDGL